jgi:hypothetical protein
VTDAVTPAAPRGRWAKRCVVALVALAVVWFGGLLVIDAIYGDRYGQRVVDRLSEAVRGDGTIDESDLALVRGRLELAGVHVAHAEAAGKLTLDVREVHCELAPGGIALFDRDCRTLAIAGIHLETTSLALFRVQKPKRPPIHVHAVTLDDIELALAPTDGSAPVRVRIAHVEADETTFKTPLSWLFGVTALRGSVELAIGTVQLSYERGTLSLSGAIFGDTPTTVAVELPVRDPDDDPPHELERILGWARARGERIVADRMKTLMPWR